MSLPLPPTPLIGRDAELATLARTIAAPSCRLLTLTGPPGVGKTRLAMAAAAEAAHRAPDGVAFVEFTPVRDPDAAISEVARVLGIADPARQPPVDRLVEFLSGKQVLLVVDNCEHVLEAASALGVLIARCPRLRILATSRERLRLASEREFPVPPLAMPERHEDADPDRLATNPSVALLLDRARAVLPDFALTPHNMHALAEICVRLDGLPLALELAAARLKLFTPAQLADRLRHRLQVLTGGARDVPARHRTLHAAISWSHDLLSEPERILFRRLSVFSGPWTLEAAEQVCGEPEVDVLATTASLVDKSLVRTCTGTPGAAGWFTMLESLREYAAGELAAHGEVQAVRSRHATYVADLATLAEAGVGTGEETLWTDWLGREHGNLRAALEHTLTAGDVEPALRLGAALGWYWHTRGHVGEGQAALDQLVATADEADPAPREDAMTAALIAAGILSWGRGDLDRSEHLLERAVRMSDSAGDLRRTAIGTAFLGHVARSRGHFTRAQERYRTAGALFEQLSQSRGVAWSCYDLGLLARERGDLRQAESLLRDSLRRFEDLEYSWAIACSAGALGAVMVRRERYDEAEPLLVDALERYQPLDDRRGIVQCLEALADLASAHGSAQSAARLLGAAAALRTTLALPPSKAEHEHIVRAEAAVERLLTPAATDQARQAGRTMPLASAIRLACRMNPPARGARRAAVSVTSRERQVAALVAAGRTNRQIGRALGIAEKTAEAHVHNVIGKLGAQSRAEVAAWAVAEGLHRPPVPK